MKKPSSTSRLIVTFGLALALALAGQASIMAYDGQGTANLVQDPGFESGVSGFFAQDARNQVTQTDIAPLRDHTACTWPSIVGATTCGGVTPSVAPPAACA